MKKFIKYSAEFLLNNSFKKSTKIQNHTLWNKNERSKNIFLKYDNILSDDVFKSFLKTFF